MSNAIADRPIVESKPLPSNRFVKLAAEVPIGFVQILICVAVSLPALRLVRFLFATSRERRQNRSWLERVAISLAVLGVGLGLTAIQFCATLVVLYLATFIVLFMISPSAMLALDAGTLLRVLLAIVFVRVMAPFAVVLSDRPFLGAFENIDRDLSVLRIVLGWRISATRALFRVGSTMILMGLSLLPLSTLLLALPLVNPSEAVLKETVAPTRSWLKSLGRRLVGLLTAFGLLIVMLAFSTEIVTVLHLPRDTFYGTVTHALLPIGLSNRLPVSLVDHWPYVVFAMYLIDLVVLVAIGKIPLSYGTRNLVVRWHITALTMVAFFVVLFMLSVMLAFVNGITKLTQQSGIPGNVLLLSDGSTDELFSNLGYGDVANFDRIVATEDEEGNPLPRPISVKQMNRGKDRVYMGSRETYCVVNQIIPNSNDRRRFVQLRIVVDCDISAAVHGLKLLDDRSRWFVDRGTDDQHRIECVLGQGVAATLGPDLGKASLESGDAFELADLQFVVVGILHTEGTTFGSEVWCSNVNLVTEALGKKSYTSYVMRVSDDSERSAQIMAYHIRNRYQTQKLKAVPEKEYFADLNKNNQQTTYLVIGVALIMALGGIFGIMNTMYSAIAQRTKDIGILRLLGFKRWQVLVSFLLESMTIALLGGLIGVLLGSLCDGFAVTSIASSGQGGGGKSVAAKLVVDRDVVLIGMLFTMVMGRLGGLVPALSAMRLKILESLR